MITTKFAAFGDEALFFVDAHERGDRKHGCYVLTSPAGPEGGLASCNNSNSYVVLISRELEDGSTAVRTLIEGVRPGSRWHLQLVADGRTNRQVVEFNDIADREGLLRSRVVVRGVENPRLRVVASRVGSGGRCVIALNPANVTTGPASGPGGLLKAI